MFVDQLEDALSALLDFALKRPHPTKLVRPHALSKDRTSRLRRAQKNFASGHAHFAAGFRNEDEIASSNFEEQVEEICLAESGGPGLGSVRQSLFVLEPISQIGNGCVAGDLIFAAAFVEPCQLAASA